MHENYAEVAAIALAFLFFLVLGIYAAKTSAENSKKRRKAGLSSHMNPAWAEAVRKNILKNSNRSGRRRKMLTLGNEQVNEEGLSQNTGMDIKDHLPKTIDQKVIEKALLENEMMRQRLLACLYKYDPYNEYY